jgi:4,5-DOPA dioxygenase extradiol
MKPRMPALFIGHGSPLQAIEPNGHTAIWQQLGRELPRPRAILSISAHWYTRGIGVTAMARPRTIHDFQGFPQQLYECQYPARGDPQLALEIQRLLQPRSVHADHEWGLDHGSWAVLRYLYPEADLPVVQLSIDGELPSRAHYEIGRQLAPLRDDGVLLLGSGDVVHNLQRLERRAGATPPAWASEFNTLVRGAIESGDHEALIDYERHGEAARLSVPTPEHYLPLLYVLGAQQPGDRVSIPVDGIELGTVSMLAALLEPAYSTAQKQ